MNKRRTGFWPCSRLTGMPTIIEVGIDRHAGQLLVHVTVAEPTELTLSIGSEGEPSTGRETITLTVPQGRHYFAVPSFSPRHYVMVTSHNGEQRRVPERVIHVNGIRNFRDIGGYPTTAGGCVRWGCVYRAADLAQISGAGLTALRTLGIRTVLDFRSPAEQKAVSLTGSISELGCETLHLPLIPSPGLSRHRDVVGLGKMAGVSVVDDILRRSANGEWPRAKVQRALQVASTLAARATGEAYISFLTASMEALREIFT
jgi:Tyrosine phosphatase family